LVGFIFGILDLKSNKLSLNEAIDVAQNRPLSTFGTMHS